MFCIAASASFQNSEEFIRLVGCGVQESRHGHVLADGDEREPPGDAAACRRLRELGRDVHPHEAQPADRTVLEVRRENGHEEPWTWVRTYGKGRVFYTAWGHDQRTWGNRGFQQLVENAVKWTAGDWTQSAAFAAALAQEPKPREVDARGSAADLSSVRHAPWNVLAPSHITECAGRADAGGVARS